MNHTLAIVNTSLLHPVDTHIKTARRLGACVLLFIVCFHYSSGLTWASSPACAAQKPSPVSKSNNILIFELVNVCQLEPINTIGLVDRYIAHTEMRDTISVININDVTTEDQPNAFVIDVVENLQTKHGDMRIEADISLSSGGSADILSYRQVSNRIRASGASALTRKVIETVDVRKNGEGLQVMIKKVLHMKKPWYAPSGVFRKEVYKGLGKDLQLISDRHLSVLQAD